MTDRERDTTRRDMRRLAALVREIRRLYPRMELGQLAVLLEVMTEPGLWAVDLGDRVDLQKSALSRNVRALSQTSYLEDERGGQRGGLDLITRIPDATDGRAFQLAPTRKGRSLAESLSRLMTGD